MCKHISILLPNRPGEMRGVADVLAHNGINILGYQLAAHGNSGSLHILCSDHDAAYISLFQKYGYYCNQSEAMICAAAHQPGEVRKILDVFDEASLNVENSYQATTSSGEVIVVFELVDRENTKSAENVLADAGISVMKEQPS